MATSYAEIPQKGKTKYGRTERYISCLVLHIFSRINPAGQPCMVRLYGWTGIVFKSINSLAV